MKSTAPPVWDLSAASELGLEGPGSLALAKDITASSDTLARMSPLDAKLDRSNELRAAANTKMEGRKAQVNKGPSEAFAKYKTEYETDAIAKDETQYETDSDEDDNDDDCGGGGRGFPKGSMPLLHASTNLDNVVGYTIRDFHQSFPETIFMLSAFPSFSSHDKSDDFSLYNVNGFYDAKNDESRPKPSERLTMSDQASAAAETKSSMVVAAPIKLGTRVARLPIEPRKKSKHTSASALTKPGTTALAASAPKPPEASQVNCKNLVAKSQEKNEPSTSPETGEMHSADVAVGVQTEREHRKLGENEHVSQNEFTRKYFEVDADGAIYQVSTPGVDLRFTMCLLPLSEVPVSDPKKWIDMIPSSRGSKAPQDRYKISRRIGRRHGQNSWLRDKCRYCDEEFTEDWNCIRHEKTCPRKHGEDCPAPPP